MALRSMTGFGASSGSADGVDWRWELRSLNGRGLDVRVRVPSGYEELEPLARARLVKRLKRGSCQLTLQVKRAEIVTEPRLNEAVFDRVLQITRRLQREDGVGPASADGLLSLRGVLELVEPAPDKERHQRFIAALSDGLDDALGALIDDRTLEGEKLSGFLNTQIDEMTRLGSAIGNLPARNPDAHLTRLKAQVDQLLGAYSEFSSDRLHHEAALLATKADIREELDRLTSHVGAGKALLAASEPVGRRLDFLAQEFNREANTICSKSGDIDTTRQGLELKAVIDQFKEQVQNVE